MAGLSRKSKFKPKAYPVSIERDRYDGAYSHGIWVVQINCYRDEVQAGDMDCDNFWSGVRGELGPEGLKQFIPLQSDQKVAAFNSLEEAVAFIKANG